MPGRIGAFYLIQGSSGSEYVLRVPRFLLHFQGEYPAFIRRPFRPPRQRIWPASSSQATCEGGSRYNAVSRLRSWPGRRPLTRIQWAFKHSVAKPPVERLDESVVGRFAWPREVERDPILVALRLLSYVAAHRVSLSRLRPPIERLRDELRTIVDPNGFWRSTDGGDTRHRFDDPLSTSITSASRVYASTTVRARSRLPYERGVRHGNPLTRVHSARKPQPTALY